MIPERKKKEIEDLSILLIETAVRLQKIRSSYLADDWAVLVGRNVASLKHALSVYQAHQHPVILDIEEELEQSAEDHEL